jgi:hypothetical protein
MIHLQVEECCQNCPAFEPEAEKGEVIDSIEFEVETYRTDTVIRCANRSLCKAMRRHFENVHYGMKGDK